MIIFVFIYYIHNMNLQLKNYSSLSPFFPFLNIQQKIRFSQPISKYSNNFKNDSKNSFNIEQAQQLISLIYGSIVSQVIASSEHFTQVNARLQKIGYRIGTKILDEYMRQTNQKACSKIQELVDRLCNVGIKKYLNPTQIKYTDLKIHEDKFSFTITIKGNPFLKNLQIPAEYKNGNLKYQSIIAGCIKGVFQMIKFKAKVFISFEQISTNTSLYLVQVQKNIHAQ